MKKLSEMSIEEMIEASEDGFNLFIEELPEDTDLSSKETNGASGKDADPEKENKNMDKREIIREIMAVSAKPVTEFAGGEEEKVETIAKLAEKLAYNPSESGANDKAASAADKVCGKDEDVDKRKLVDEIGGILKGKVDEELWRTIIGKAEKLAYNKSEAGIANDEAEEEEEPKGDPKETKPALSMDAMEKEISARLAAKSVLAEKLKPFIGCFDHAGMSIKDMAVYACGKLNKKVAEDSALDFLNGYLEAAKAPAAEVVMDEAPSGFNKDTDEAFESYLKGE